MKKDKPTGNCIDMALHNSEDNGLLFCFGKAENPDGTKLIHAWNEDEYFVYDGSNGNNIKAKKSEYYEKQKINPEEVKRLTFKQCMKKINRFAGKGKNEIGWVR